MGKGAPVHWQDLFKTALAIECAHKYSMRFRTALSIKLIVAMLLFLK
jgi:hypothetical protein